MPRKRTAAVNIRVTDTEKRKMERNARICGLGLSAYLRELAMGHQVKPLGPEALRSVYNAAENVRRNAKSLAPIQIDVAMRSIEQMILRIYREGGDDHGRNEDMAGEG